MISGRHYGGFWQKNEGAERTLVWSLSFSVAISDLRNFQLLNLEELNGSLGAGN
jgi:hypothetical protein